MTLGEANLPETLEELELEDQLSCIAADLVEYQQNYLFLERLFAAKSGQWLDVDSLCQGVPQVKTQLQQLRTYFQSISLASDLVRIS